MRFSSSKMKDPFREGDGWTVTRNDKRFAVYTTPSLHSTEEVKYCFELLFRRTKDANDQLIVKMPMDYDNVKLSPWINTHGYTVILRPIKARSSIQA